MAAIVADWFAYLLNDVKVGSTGSTNIDRDGHNQRTGGKV
jgi:hypothetical protein